jgi:hypothetical protein
MTAFVTLKPKNNISSANLIRDAALRLNSNLQRRNTTQDTLQDTVDFLSDRGILNQNIQTSTNTRDNLNNQEISDFRNFALGTTLLNSGVTFYMTPNVGESGSATYGEISDIRMPASVIYYLGSPSRSYSISAKLFARTTTEANRAYRDLRLLRSWRMPEVGPGGPRGVELATGDAGASTPRILNLSGYNGMFNDITCVMTELNITYPEDVDYIPTSGGVMVPVFFDVSVSLKEGRSLKDLENFDINSFRSGRLPNW